jgi:eukaryotic-like serine/threonine-protein kinase
MSDAAENEERIFADALSLAPSERAEFLAQACGGNAVLRRRVEALIDAHAAAERFMTTPAAGAAAGAAADRATQEDRPGTRIGRYKLLQLLGEGGCGVVWMAEQEEPVRRRVALKVIKLGMDTKMVITRFEAERQALALMDHPNIARVFDAGATESGRPYFVMELVPGVPITKYCDQHNLSTAARLRLFAPVCHAVQHAHQKGIIHRDLKPSNVLVTLHDGEPTPKVIDFGIAKATQGRLTDHTLFTAFEQFIGTPAYMSPEQAEMSGVDVDTRSDIYSLGVLLYELLTGQPPFDPRSLVQAGLDEIRRIIREVEPPKPSTKLNTLADSDRATTAQRRGTAPAQLSVLLRGDLDWIVMKALEKNPSRRYATANGLALDLQRHLQHEPVSARPPSLTYRMSRFVRRHRLVVACALVVALALLAATIVSTREAWRARRAERVAERERAAAVQERARAEDLLGFMLGDLRQQLAKVGRLDVLESVGDKAMAYFASRRAAGLDDAELTRYAKALAQIGEIRMDEARYPEALAAFTEAYDRASALVARHPRDGAMAFERGQAEFWIGFVQWKRGDMDAAADWLTRYHHTALALVALDPKKPEWQSEVAYSNHNLAAVRKERGDFAAARAGFEAELATLQAMAAADPKELELQYRIADAHSWLGGVAWQQGDLAGARDQYRAQTATLERLVLAEPRTPRWRLKAADAQLYEAEALLVSGQVETARQCVLHARSVLDEVQAHDRANRQWEITGFHARLLDAELRLHDRAWQPVLGQLDDLRPKLEALAAAEPTDRLLTRWRVWAYRLEAQADRAMHRDAAAAAARASDAAEMLVRERRATTADIAEYAAALNLAGEIALDAGDREAARRQWEHAAELLSAYVATHDTRLLDPAARAAYRLGRTERAKEIRTQLEHIGYVPLEPWPETAPVL